MSFLARFDYDNVPEAYRDHYPFVKDRIYMLTELSDMPGHSRVEDIQSGEVLGNYHTENFVEP